MNDNDLRGALTALADQMPTNDIAQQAVDAGRHRKLRARSAIATGTIALTVAAILTPLAIVGRDHHSTSADTNRPTLGRDAGLEFQVAPPTISRFSGIPPMYPDCTAAQLRGSARLARTTGGVAGVVNLTGNHCRLDGSSIEGLVSNEGDRLAVPTTANPNARSPAAGLVNAQQFAQEGVGYGFSWYGSWCDEAPVAVRIRLHSGSIDVPLFGPTPPCRRSTNTQLITGAIGTAGQPLQGAPPSWRNLTVQFGDTGPAAVNRLQGLTVTFTNRGTSTVYLDPLPNYLIGVQDKRGDGTQVEAQGPLPAGDGRLRVGPKGGALTVGIPDVDVSQDASDFVGKSLIVTFQMAGVPSTSITVPRSIIR